MKKKKHEKEGGAALKLFDHLLKTDQIIVVSWEDADTSLKYLALLKAKIDADNAELAAAVVKINERYEKKIAPLLDNYAEIEEKVKSFASAARADLKNKKSWKGNFGAIKFRKNPDSFKYNRPVEAVIAALKGYGHDEAVKIEEKIVKAELKKISAKDLLEVGITRKPGIEEVKVEPDLEAIIAISDQQSVIS